MGKSSCGHIDNVFTGYFQKTFVTFLILDCIYYILLNKILMLNLDSIIESSDGELITERELALGALAKPDYRGDYSDCRYMIDEEVVSFDVLTRQSDFNWEFYLNGDKTRKIWFSQLDGCFLSGKGTGVYSCRLILKNGGGKHITLMSVDQFWNEVRGKRYKITVDYNKYEIDRWHRNCVNRPMAEVANSIFKALDEERYDDVKGMTRSKPLYILREV